MTRILLALTALVMVSLANDPALAAPAGPQQLLYAAEGNRLRRIDVDTITHGPQRDDVLVDRASAGEGGGGLPVGPFRDVNGVSCLVPDGSGRFLMGEDTGQPDTPPGWGIFDRAGTQVGKLTATYFRAQGEPFGCAFDADGRLFTTSVGDEGFGPGNGQLILWFPPYEGFPGPPGAYPDTDAVSENFCKLAVDLGTAGEVMTDAEGNVYVATAGTFRIEKFAPPFPTGPDAAGGCGQTDALGSPLADVVQRSNFIAANPLQNTLTFSGLARAGNGNIYASSVFTGTIAEYDLAGNFVRHILLGEAANPPHVEGSPQGLAVDAAGSLYFADLDLVFPNPGPGPDGRVRRIRFDAAGNPLPPETLLDGLAFPDGVAMLPGNLEPEWPTLAGNPERTFFNADESILTPANVGGLVPRWNFTTDAIITSSAVVATVELPLEGLVYAVFFQSWDGNVYALRLSDGREIWRFETELHPGGSFPNTATVHVDRVDDEPRVFVGNGQHMYALDARTGQEIWRFTVGTGCRDAQGDPPGLCGFDGERNQIESSAILAEGTLMFGMDVNDVATGKGGFYGVDARDGTMRWFFDLESGSTCRPDPGDEIRRFDGYHTEAELGLPAGFLATRDGCDFPRTPNGCGNVWSSASADFERRQIFVASSNCDTDDDPLTNEPPPPMPPYDEAIFSLDFDGNAVWVWRPREVDNDDLAYGGAPNLFTIDFGGDLREVVGVGNKDGTYVVIDRDGVNEVSGVAWDDADPSALPYWITGLVPGGAIGGVVATAAVDETTRRVFVNTAPGFDPLNPQLPFVHALNLDTGAIEWTAGSGTDEASFGPVSGFPGVVFVGGTNAPRLRAYQAEGDDGSKILDAIISSQLFGAPVAMGPAAIGGVVLVGSGIGQRSGDPNDFAEITSRFSSQLLALCVPGTLGCAACDNGVDDDLDGLVDDDDDGCLSSADPSEVRGDLDYDTDVDENDRAILLANALGTLAGDPDFFDAADFDRDGVVGLADYGLWNMALRAFLGLPPPMACGLLGVEPLLVLGGLFALRRRFERRR